MGIEKTAETNNMSEKNENLVVRYSDAELEEFKDIIMKRLEVARKELKYLEGQLRGKNEKGEELAGERHLTIEDGSATMELEQIGRLAERQIQFINNLENALLRIKYKTYGICRVTGKLIDKARLRAVPHATLSMEAKKK